MLEAIGSRGQWAVPREIVTWSTSGEWLTVPRGGMERVRAALARVPEGVQVDVRDKRLFAEKCELPQHKYTPYPHQRGAVEALLKKENCLLRAPTGSGKTCIGFMLAAELQLPTIVLVWNKGLFKQWMDRVPKELGIARKDVGEIHGSVCKVRPLTIAMQQTLAKRGVVAGVHDYFGCVIMDEVHRAAASTMFASVDLFPARYRYGISDDERRKDKKEFLTFDLFAAVGCELDEQELIRDGYILDVETYVVETDFRADWYSTDKGETTDDGEPKEINFNRVLEEMRTDAAREQVGLDLVEQLVGEGEQVLVMTHRREHCHQIERALVSKGIPTGLMLGGDDYSTTFDKSKEALVAGRLRVGVGTYQAIGTGIDLPGVSACVAMTPIASNRSFWRQVRGRLCRTAEGKSRSRIFYLWDRNVRPWRGHLQNLAKWNNVCRLRHNGQWIDANDESPRRKAFAT